MISDSTVIDTVGSTDADKLEIERVRAEKQIPTIRYNGGWQNKYGEVAELLGYKMDRSFRVYKDGVYIGHLNPKKDTDLVRDLPLLLKRHRGNEAKKRADQLREIAVYAATRESPRGVINSPIGGLGRVRAFSAMMAFAGLALAGGDMFYDRPSRRLRR